MSGSGVACLIIPFLETSDENEVRRGKLPYGVLLIRSGHRRRDPSQDRDSQRRRGGGRSCATASSASRRKYKNMG